MEAALVGGLAVSLYVAHYNLCRPHESLRSTPAVAQCITDYAWLIGELLDAALATQPIEPVVTAPDRRRVFRVIEGGKAYEQQIPACIGGQGTEP